MAVDESLWLVAQTDAPEPILPDDGGVAAFWTVLFGITVVVAAGVWWAVRSVRSARRTAEQASADVEKLRSEVHRSAS